MWTLGDVAEFLSSPAVIARTTGKFVTPNDFHGYLYPKSRNCWWRDYWEDVVAHESHTQARPSWRRLLGFGSMHTVESLWSVGIPDDEIFGESPFAAIIMPATAMSPNPVYGGFDAADFRHEEYTELVFSVYQCRHTAGEWRICLK